MSHTTRRTLEMTMAENAGKPQQKRTLTTQSDPKCLVHFLDSSGDTREHALQLAVDSRTNTESAYPVDYLPTDVLLSLAKPADRFENLGPNAASKIKKGHSPPKTSGKKPPDNVWNHPKSREKLKHLVDQPPCICGAGRDISFLYDAISAKKGGREQTESSDNKPTIGIIKTQNKKQAPGTKSTADSENRDPASMVDSIVPSEFHIVKNPGVLGLEFHDEKYTTKTEDHQHHLTLFPSMKPAGRQEVLQLRHTMDALLQRAGVTNQTIEDDDKTIDDDEDVPTQIHKLLALVKQEQTIYNVIFSELIRQVTVECMERGELLADLRQRYARLLDRVPRHVKSLHEEVLAQRALDRRLTEELSRFKSSITLLTRELNDVKAHDKEVTKQAKETQEELKTALQESEKNASLLTEYHELYELQRKRLEYQISSLIEERDVWAGGSYILALKVARRHNLTTSKRLHLHERGWHKLAGHFAISLNNQDSLQLQELNNQVQAWQDVTLRFNKKLCDAESVAYQKFKSMQRQLKAWGQDFLRVVTPEEATVHAPNEQLILRLCEDIKAWEEMFNVEAERFTGDALLACEDDLVQMNRLVDKWTDIGVQIFGRHPPPLNGMSEQHQRMLDLNKQVESFHRHFKLRMTGENGLAKGLIHFINVFNTWGNKLNTLAKGGETMLDPEWVRLADFIQSEWPESLLELILLVAPEDAEDEPTKSKMSLASSDKAEDVVSIYELREIAQKWIKDTTVWIENEDGSLIDQVTRCHSDMVKWMVTVLHRLAPDLDPPEETMPEQESSDGSIGIGAAILAECTSEEIMQRAKLLFRRIRLLTKKLYNSSVDVVVAKMQEKKDAGDETSEFEYKDLKKTQVECDGWIKTAHLLVAEITGETLPDNESEDNEKAKQDMAIVKEEQEKEAKSTETKAVRKNITDTEGKPTLTDVVTNTPDVTNDCDVATNELQRSKEETKKDTRTYIKASDRDERVSDHAAIEEKTSNVRNEMHFIGRDENIKKKSLDEIVLPSPSNETLDSQGSIVPGTVEALSTIGRLQQQLLECEERAQNAEDRAINAEVKLKDALEKIRALERAASKVSPAKSRPLSGSDT